MKDNVTPIRPSEDAFDILEQWSAAFLEQPVSYIVGELQRAGISEQLAIGYTGVHLATFASDLTKRATGEIEAETDDIMPPTISCRRRNPRHCPTCTERTTDSGNRTTILNAS